MFLVAIFFFNGCAPAIHPIHQAVRDNDLNGLKKEVESGVDVDLRVGTGSTPLLRASQFGQLEMVKYLIANGADINAQNVFGTPLVVASRNGHLEIVKYLIANGADINAKNGVGYTPLMWASKSGNLETVKYLIGEGVDIDTKSKDGSTALIIASGHGNLEIVKYLRSKGADIDIKDSEGKTALDYARINNDKHLVDYFQNELPNIQKKQEELRLAELQKEQSNRVQEYISSKNYEGLKEYTDANPNAVYYIEDEALRLVLTGPKGMKVGDIRKLVKEGEDEVIITSLIKRVDTPYKKYTIDEIKYLKSLGLSSNIISAMIDVTTQLFRDEKMKKQQEFFLAEQERIAKEHKKTTIVHQQNQQPQQVDAQGNPIVEKVKDEIIKQGIGMLLDHIF
jgi:hypothetical protein